MPSENFDPVLTCFGKIHLAVFNIGVRGYLYIGSSPFMQPTLTNQRTIYLDPFKKLCGFLLREHEVDHLLFNSGPRAMVVYPQRISILKSNM